MRESVFYDILLIFIVTGLIVSFIVVESVTRTVESQPPVSCGYNVFYDHQYLSKDRESYCIYAVEDGITIKKECDVEPINVHNKCLEHKQ